MSSPSPRESAEALRADDGMAAWRPALRPLQVQRVESDGDRGFAFDDPLGILPGTVFVPEGLAPVLGRLDGTRGIADIEHELRDEGVEVPDGLVLRLCRDFEESLLLRGDLFDATLERTVDEFVGTGVDCPVRSAQHAGGPGYPASPAACEAAMDTLLGPIPERPTRPAPRALIAPHIDVERGQLGYAAAYRDLAECAPADLYVVFGTAHAGSLASVIGLPHDWATPVGLLRCDRELVRDVHAARGPATRDELFLHRAEHSIEFQMLFLARVLRDRAPHAKVAGFLCGRLPHVDGRPGAAPGVDHLVATLRTAALGDGSRRVTFIAGADLAHIGPDFGDDDAVSDARLAQLEKDDRWRLDALLDGDPEEFHRRAVATGNPDRLCSTAAMYLVARLAQAPAASGAQDSAGEAPAPKLLHYGQSPADDGSQCVSWCAVSYPGLD